jgi:hypothetical protein
MKAATEDDLCSAGNSRKYNEVDGSAVQRALLINGDKWNI